MAANQKPGPESFAIFGIQLLPVPSPDHGQRLPTRQQPGLRLAHRPVQNPELADRTVQKIGFAGGRPVAGAEHQRRAGPDRPLQDPDGPPEALGGHDSAVQVEVHAGALAHAVVGDHQVGPPVRLQLVFLGAADAYVAAILHLNIERRPVAEDLQPPTPVGVFQIDLPGQDHPGAPLPKPEGHGNRKGTVRFEAREILCLYEGVLGQIQEGDGTGPVDSSRSGQLQFPLLRTGAEMGCPAQLQGEGLGAVEFVQVQIEMPVRLQPALEFLFSGPLDLVPLVSGGRLLPPQLFPPHGVTAGRHDHHRRRIEGISVQGFLGGVAEEGGQRIEVLLGDGIELVVVAGGATHRQAQPDRAGGVDPVLGVHDLHFLFDDAPFVGGDVAAMEAGGDELFRGRIGQQVAGQLVHRELVEGQVPVEGPDDPVPVGPHLTVIVDMQAVGVAVAGRIEPIAAPVLPIGRGSHEAVGPRGVRVRRGVRHKLRHFLRIGRQTGEIQ